MPLRTLPVFACLMAFAVLVLALSRVGYIASDDQMYIIGATGWMEHFPYVGNNHWTLRHTLVLPIAAAFSVFGVNEFALSLPISLYYLALLALVFVMTNRYFGLGPATIAVVLLACMPLMAIQSTIVFPDFAEVFFCLLSLSLFLEATRAKRPMWLLVLAGMAAGFGWLTRETVAFFLLTYGILFLVGFGLPRRLYFIMAAGFLAVVGVEAVYFAILTDSPFYRLITDLRTHLKVDATEGLGAVGEGMSRSMEKVEGAQYGAQSRTGNFSVNRFLDPILAILVNQEFMFFYYLALPAALWIAFTNRSQPQDRRLFIQAFGLAAVLWFACIWLQIATSLLPRYYMFPTVIVAIFFAVWLHDVVARRSALLLAAILAFLVVTNALGIYVDNRDPLFAERKLVDYLSQNNERVLTDPETVKRGSFLYRVAGVSPRLTAGIPQPGDLFYFNPTYTTARLKQRNSPDRTAALSPYLPRADWQEVWRVMPERRWTGRLIEALGLKPVVPPEIFLRLDTPDPPVVVYRVTSPANGGG